MFFCGGYTWVGGRPLTSWHRIHWGGGELVEKCLPTYQPITYEGYFRGFKNGRLISQGHPSTPKSTCCRTRLKVGVLRLSDVVGSW